MKNIRTYSSSERNPMGDDSIYMADLAGAPGDLQGAAIQAAVSSPERMSPWRIVTPTGPTQRRIPWGRVSALDVGEDYVATLLSAPGRGEPGFIPTKYRAESIKIGPPTSTESPYSATHRTLTFGSRADHRLIFKAWLRRGQVHVLGRRNYHRAHYDPKRPQIMTHWDLSTMRLVRGVSCVAAWCDDVAPWYFFISPEPTFAGVAGALLSDGSEPKGKGGDEGKDEGSSSGSDFGSSCSKEEKATKREWRIVFRHMTRDYPGVETRLTNCPDGLLEPTQKWYLHLFDSHRDRGIEWPQGQNQLFYLDSATDRHIIDYWTDDRRHSLLFFDFRGSFFYGSHTRKKLW